MLALLYDLRRPRSEFYAPHVKVVKPVRRATPYSPGNVHGPSSCTHFSTNWRLMQSIRSRRSPGESMYPPLKRGVLSLPRPHFSIKANRQNLVLFLFS